MSTDAASFDALPDDVATLRRELLVARSALARTRGELAHTESVLAETAIVCETQQTQLAKLQEELDLLKRHVYGRRSERHVEDPRQGLLPLGEEPAEPPVVPAIEEEITYRRRKGHGWSKLPAHLDREEILLDVPEDQRCCPDCQQPMEKIGEDRSERVELVPARIWIKVLVRPKYACRRQHGIVQAPAPPAPVPGGRFDFGFVAHVVTSKTADHLPLYRQQDILARSGLELSRATMCGIMAGAADLGALLVALMIRRLLAVNRLGADDTPVRLLDSAHPNGVRTARFWLFRGFNEPGCSAGQAPSNNDSPYNVFHFHESRGRDGPSKFLEHFRGTVKVDAYGVDGGVYLGSGGRIVASCCWAHARRKFDEAKSSHPRLASEALAFIQQLYDIEDRARELAPDERRALRQTEAKPVLDRFRTWLDAQAALALPKLKFGEAIGYARNQWSALVNYVDDGRLPIDNNDVERDLRALTIGRKNWLFVGSPLAGPRAAVLYTLVASAARHDLDVWAYLRDVLERLAVLKARGGKECRDDVRDDDVRDGGARPTDEELTPLLPDVWAKSHPEAVRSYRQHEREGRAAANRARRAKRRALAHAQAARTNHG